MKKGTDNWL